MKPQRTVDGRHVRGPHHPHMPGRALAVMGTIGRLQHRYRALRDQMTLGREHLFEHLTFPRRRELPSAEWTYAQCLDTLMRAADAVVSLALERRPTMDIYMARLDAGRADT
jgi:hypothetical protein